MFSFFRDIRQINHNLRQIKSILRQMNMRMIHPSLKVFNIRSLMKDGEVTTSTGLPFTIVHQYDRVPEWRKIIEAKYG